MRETGISNIIRNIITDFSSQDKPVDLLIHRMQNWNASMKCLSNGGARVVSVQIIQSGVTSNSFIGQGSPDNKLLENVTGNKFTIKLRKMFFFGIQITRLKNNYVCRTRRKIKRT